MACLAIATVLISPAIRPVQATDYGKPNIVMILVDDLGYGDLGYMGALDLKSPHLDGLAARGVKFSNFYANCPVCSPSRAALLTGRYQAFVGVPGVIRTHPENNWGYLSESATLIPEVLKPAGYHTAIVGKWHLGLESPNTPMDRGFDHLHGFLGRHDGRLLQPSSARQQLHVSRSEGDRSKRSRDGPVYEMGD